MVEPQVSRCDSPPGFSKGTTASHGLPRPASSASSLAFSSEDGISSSGNFSSGSFQQRGLGAAAPGAGSSSGNAAYPQPSGSPTPRSLITWDSFNSTDFNTLKSAVGLNNVSAAFAWSPGPLSPQPGGMPQELQLGLHNAGSVHSVNHLAAASGSESQHGSASAAFALSQASSGLFAAPSTPPLPQNGGLMGSQPSTPGAAGGLGLAGNGSIASSAVSPLGPAPSFLGQQRQLHRYLSEPPRPEELAAAASIPESLSALHFAGAGADAPSPLAAALHRHSIGAPIPELGRFQQPPTTSFGSSFNFCSSPQMFAAAAPAPLFIPQPQSPGAHSSMPPGSPGMLHVQQQQQLQSDGSLGVNPAALSPHVPQLRVQNVSSPHHQQQWVMSQRQQPGLPRASAPRRTVSFDGGAGIGHGVGSRAGMRGPGFVHGAGLSRLDSLEYQHMQQQQQQQLGRSLANGHPGSGIGGPQLGTRQLDRSSSFGTFAPPSPYQPAGNLRRHVSMGSALSAGLSAAAAGTQPPPSPTLAAANAPFANGGFHGGLLSPGGAGGGLSPAGLHLNALAPDEAFATAHHRRVCSADFGTPPRDRRARGPMNAPSGRGGRGAMSSGGRASPVRELSFAGLDAGGSYGRIGSNSGSGSPQVLSRSTSGAALAARGAIGSPGVAEGSGYRQLWARVTQMQQGGADMPPPGEETTVEDLLRVVRQLPADAEAVPAVVRGLHYLDSRALAALLKELAKVGLPNRASEIFDWLRGLPSSHPLASLCDVYTYTTIVAQCGAGPGLGAALSLAAEMRQRGIVLNCHAFSALMNVCIKAGELDLALDVFQSMLREGCTPNLVTYNILIDIYGKTGQWEEAVKVLDALQSQGTAPEVRTYNTIIGACARAGQPGAAAAVYRRMLAEGAAPTATTATALVSAFAKTGQVEEALAILQDMASRGAERSPVAYGALVAAADRGSRPELALQLFDEMLRAGLKPSAATFSAALSACSQSGHWERGLEVFELMRGRGCKPDAAAFASLLSALAAGRQWPRALHIFSRMQAAGVRAEAAHHNALLEALWSGATLTCQARTLAALDAALSTGGLRLPALLPEETALAVATGGAAVASTLHWLLAGPAFRADTPPASSATSAATQNGGDSLGGGRGSGNATEIAGRLRTMSMGLPLRRVPSDVGAPPALGRMSLDGRQQPAEPQQLPASRVLLLHRDRAWAAAAQPVEEVASAVMAALTGMQAPVQIAVTPQGIRLEAQAAAVREWAESAAAKPAAAVVALASRTRGGAEVLADEDAAKEARCRHALNAVQEFELRDCLRPDVFASEEAAAARRRRLEALTAAAKQLDLPAKVASDALQVGDRAVCLGAEDDASLTAASLLLAARQASCGLEVSALCETVGVSADDVAPAVQQAEARLGRCQAGAGAVSAPRILPLLLERLGADSQEDPLAAWVGGNAEAVLHAALSDPKLLAFPASTAAAAALLVARRIVGATPAWPPCLTALTGHQNPTEGLLAACAAVVLATQPQPAAAAAVPEGPTVSAPTEAVADAISCGPMTPAAPGSEAPPAQDSSSTVAATESMRASRTVTQDSEHTEQTAAADDGGLTEEDMAELRARLSDFGVSDD